MRILEARNPDQGLAQALQQVLLYGIPTDSRNGPVLRFSTPVTTAWTSPLQRVSFSAVRDANPAFALMEALWMLAGRNDIKTMGFYAKQMLSYSDDGETQNAAYGHRWRTHFGHDQLDEVVEILKKDPNSRQAVVQIWDHVDLTKSTKDKACNTQAIFDIVHGCLNMTICNRSNDIIWGCYGANVVHFSLLLEYMANRIGVPVGTYYQMSNNLHLYTEFDITKRFIEPREQVYATGRNPYSIVANSLAYQDLYVAGGGVRPMSLGADVPGFEDELQEIVNDYQSTKRYIRGIPFFNEVAEPMRCAYACWKDGNKAVAEAIIAGAKGAYRDKHGHDNDWLTAMHRWIGRRIYKEQQA